MPAKQLRGRLRRKARQKTGALIDQAWAVILNVIYENTAPQKFDDNNKFMKTEASKNFGTVNPGIR
jgi:hypothetical protein